VPPPTPPPWWVPPQPFSATHLCVSPPRPLARLVLQELPVDVIGHRSPPDVDKRHCTPSPPPSPSRHPRGESPVLPPCPAPPRSSPGAHRLDPVASRAPPSHRQAHHRALWPWASSRLGRAEPTRRWAEWPAQHYAPVFRLLFPLKKFQKSLKISKIPRKQNTSPKNAK
jgi:hypothetical protein